VTARWHSSTPSIPAHTAPTAPTAPTSHPAGRRREGQPTKGHPGKNVQFSADAGAATAAGTNADPVRSGAGGSCSELENRRWRPAGGNNGGMWWVQAGGEEEDQPSGGWW